MKDEFLNFHKSFNAKIKPTYEPKNMGDWYDKVLEAKKPLNKYLPDLYTTLDIEVPEEDNTIPTKEIDPYIDPILKTLPKYLNEYRLTKQSLLRPTLKDHKNISVAKHILTYAKRHKIDEEKIKIIEKNLSSLGQIYAKFKFTKITKKVTLTYDPLAFLVLGNFACDMTSCFGQGSRINTEKRFAFGVHPSFFILLFHRNNNDIDIKKDTSNIDGRMFGIFTDDFKVLNFSNGYGFCANHKIRHFCKGIYEKIMSKNKSVLTENQFRFTGGLTYTDGPLLSFSTQTCAAQVCNLTDSFYKERCKIK